MTQRTDIERSTSTSDDGGGSTASWTQVLSDVPCRGLSFKVRATGTHEEVITGLRPTEINTRIVIVPPDVDVRLGDKLTEVRDRRGNVIFRGPLIVDAIDEKSTGEQHRLTTRLIV